ncbi:MAG TPA: response regulator transcription factor [Flavipsychrobacter sp.]|jgi:DNA-binding NarL/FixJ family response regulator|nr:response regulator transcription factor [Flavipsychrobacter sp.]
MAIQVGIIEDEKQIRESLQLLINGSEGFSCVHSFSNAEDALAALPDLSLDVVLTDINLPGMSGIECIAMIKDKCPATNFLICTSFEDSENVFKALKAGATGYLTKTTQPSKLLDSITEIYNGGSPMNTHIARKIVLSFNETNHNTELQKLSKREQDILEFLSKGLRYKEIADKLFLSTETVRTHIRNIYQKLQVNSRTDALNKVYKK